MSYPQLISDHPDPPSDGALKVWKHLCDIGREIISHPEQPALQDLYFEGIEMWCTIHMFRCGEGEEWDRRKKNPSAG